MSGRRVLVTGGNGFTGERLIRRLLQEGCAVRTLARRPQALAADVRCRIEVAAGDVRDRRAVEQAVAGCDTVYHVAGLYRDTSVGEQTYWDVNVGGTEHVLAACEAHRVKRLVHCSTVGVHGDVSQAPSDETAPFAPTDGYQRSKAAAEERVWTWHRRTQLPTAVVRPAGIYGPGDLRFLKFFRSIQGGYFLTLGNGKTWFHMVYIDDLIEGYLRCGMRDEAVGEAFIICGDRYVALDELVALTAQALGVQPPRWRAPVWPFYAAGAVCEAVCVPLKLKPPLHRRRVGFFTHNRAFSCEKARRLLGYAPQVRLEEGLRRVAAWYAAQGHLKPVNGYAVPAGAGR